MPRLEQETMAEIASSAMSALTTPVIVYAAVTLVTVVVCKAFYNLYLHPLARFPGPKAAAVTNWWKTYIEVFLGRSFHLQLQQLHAEHGPVVRVAPNELHFSEPKAYHDIYNGRNRWDKEKSLYHSFGEDRSSFGYLTYEEARPRKNQLNKLFSQTAIVQAKGLVHEKINAFCKVVERRSEKGEPLDFSLGLRCLTMDVITYLCFGNSIEAIEAPNFEAPIIVAMDASLPVFRLFKHFEIVKLSILKCPPSISRVTSPATSGLIDLQQIIKRQIKNLVKDPRNLQHLPHNMTIYNHMLDKESIQTGTAPDPGSLYEESQALMFAGSDTSAAAMMMAIFHLLKQPQIRKKLEEALRNIWPKLSAEPSLRKFEELPYLNAVIKEGLRLSSGVISGLLRIVPADGAKIAGEMVPPKAVVSCGSTFVHYNKKIFPDPESFAPERWLDNPSLDEWLVSFSRGPRSCLGINLAWMEMRLTLAHLFRRFELTLDSKSPERMDFKEAFLPFFYTGNLWVRVKPVDD